MSGPNDNKLLFCDTLHLPFTGLVSWDFTACLSETGTVSTDLLGSGLLLGLDPGGEPTKVNRTLDTLPWKKLSQLATLGYFTSTKKKVHLHERIMNGTLDKIDKN